MKTVEMYLVDGTVMTLTMESFDLAAFTDGLNDNRILATNINGKVINKQLFKVVIDKSETAPNVKISLNDMDLQAYVETYDASAITAQINDQRTLFTSVGNIAFNKRNFKLVEQI